MPKRSLISKSEADRKAPASGSSVIHLAEARLSKNAVRESPNQRLEEIRLLLDQGLATEAQKRIAALMKAARHDASLTARARCALSMSLEMQGRYRESLEAVAPYETQEGRAGLDAEALASVRVHIGLACNYTGDHPKAIAVLNTALREAAETGSDTQIGNVYVALARVYRSINEYTIARDHGRKALEHFRTTGDWRGLAEAWFAVAMADFYEGRWETALDGFGQARTLIGERPASYLLGKIYINMAGSCWFLKRPHEGISYLEKAVSYFETTEHKSNAIDGYNNLGINLTLIGEWDRAQEALERALALASEIDERQARVPMILDSLGELRLMRGDVEEAEQMLERAVTIATEHGNKWYESQALRTLSQCHLAMNDPARALDEARRALALGERISDRQAVCESRLLLAEAQLQSGTLSECEAELQALAEETKDSPEDLAITGEAQRLHGLVALAGRDSARAAHHFGRCISIFELLGDVYRGALAHYLLGRAHAVAQPERAAEHLSASIKSFQKLGARLALAQAEEALASLDRSAPARQDEVAALVQMLTLRLTEATASRELLLHELAAVIREETGTRQILIIEPQHNNERRGNKVALASGWTENEAAALAKQFGEAAGEGEQERFATEHNLSLFLLKPTKASPAVVLTAPRDSARLPFGLSISSLLRVAELGLNTCALHEKERAGADDQEQSSASTQDLMPGFIHSSPAMTRLVEEIYKIRSSDVTVLVTGESGTGKELVARAIHAHSSRRAKVFVPFNCTAVPKELSDAFLFGYKRGAFTGAVADSAGVIRAAEGGTLFLDEVGDLPLEIQPKLLRFLQEGEIQPLGEQRPVKVDVRVIAATNTDLEEMVAGGRFREDLYYRLNVIRLKVPPLRERRSEIPSIVSHYIRHYSEKFGRRGIQVSPQALDLLMVFDWPGNVRQLTNEIQRTLARAEDGAVITPDHLSPELRRNALPGSLSASPSSADAAGYAFWQEMTIPEAVDHLKRLMISEALRKNGGNISRTARELKMTRRGLQLMLSRYDMDSNDF
ncbi:MAG TPA: sigma 54-interacting transcriptional regulator [Blastocatellia bacterium]|nr:sigma 54-interacting transcriptional regulator [Blastocatellia bacterium]